MRNQHRRNKTNFFARGILFLLFSLGIHAAPSAAVECQGDCRDGYGTRSYLNGNVYIGQWSKGLREGEGTMIYADGASYKGEWFEGKRHGYGVYHWSSGNCYQGGWHLGKRQGYGRLTWVDGGFTEGMWHDDKFIGEAGGGTEPRAATLNSFRNHESARKKSSD